MGSSIASEDGRFRSTPTIGGFLSQVSRIPDQSERAVKLDDYVHGLEVETRKIEVFKRELPMCMRILNDALVAFKEEVVRHKESTAVLQEFIPGRSDVEDEKNDEISDKMNWGKFLQLYNNSVDDEINPQMTMRTTNVSMMMVWKEDYDEVNGNPDEDPDPDLSNYLVKLKAWQKARKLRRTWTNKLHDQFVDVVNRLGGAQCCELMASCYFDIK